MLDVGCSIGSRDVNASFTAPRSVWCSPALLARAAYQKPSKAWALVLRPNPSFQRTPSASLKSNVSFAVFEACMRSSIKQFTFLFFIFCASTVSAQAYRCTDKNGKTSFQERPCEINEKQTELDIKRAPELTPEQQRIISATASGKVTRGMTAAQVRSSWGRPTKINKSVGSYGSHEQWVYDRGNFRSQYVYLENGIVTSFQSPE